MGKNSSLQARKTPLYGGCLMVAPDGQPLCRTNEDRIEWYLERKLGEIISYDPLTLRLLFEPKGRKGASLYKIAEKENCCVVCGKNEITRHHVVPYCFRKCFHISYKEHNLHDVLILCIDCHKRYETLADKKKRYYAIKYDVPFSLKENEQKYLLNKSLAKVRGVAFAIKNHSNKIPPPKLEKLFDILREFLGKKEIEKEDVEKVESLSIFDINPNYKSFGELIVEKIENIDDFIREWRSHFIECMKPEFLPAYWSINYQV